MALFGRKNKAPGSRQPAERSREPADTHPLVGRRVYCQVCDADRTFSRCWRRTALMRRCPACGALFESPGKLYRDFQPECPQCAEPLEQVGFDYGICDGCGSKYEIVEGTKPGLLPNQRQRAERARIGKTYKRKP